MKSYAEKLRNLGLQRNDPFLIKKATLDERFKAVREGDSTKYALEAMQEIDPESTKRIFGESKRVQNQLETGFDSARIDCEFRNQGSVTNNTHIKFYSDIDLLAIHKDFFTCKPPLKPENPYDGDPVEDLRKLRKTAVAALNSAFPKANLDSSNNKCLSISDGSLKSSVDIVPANWYHTVEFKASGLEYLRGIMILDNGSGERIPNFPFLHNYRVNEKDDLCNGSLRKIIRLLKRLKYEAEPEIEISSYDITAIAYNMSLNFLTVPQWADLTLVNNCNYYLRDLIKDEVARSNMKVPNLTRSVFEAVSLNQLQRLQAETNQLVNDIQNETVRSFVKLSEARIRY